MMETTGSVDGNDKHVFDIMTTGPNSTYVTINISTEHVNYCVLTICTNLSLYEKNSISRTFTCFILPNNLRHNSTLYSC